MSIYHLSTWMIKEKHNIWKLLLVDKRLVVDVYSGWLDIYNLFFRSLKIKDIQVIVKIAVKAAKHD